MRKWYEASIQKSEGILEKENLKRGVGLFELLKKERTIGKRQNIRTAVVQHGSR